MQCRMDHCFLSIDAFSMTVLQKQTNGENRRIAHLDEILNFTLLEVQKCLPDEVDTMKKTRKGEKDKSKSEPKLATACSSSF